MHTSAGILALAQPSALILIDELGRGTSPNEGFSFACAITERLLTSQATVFCATHYTELLFALQHHSGIVLQHLNQDGEAFEGDDRPRGGQQAVSYRVCKGAPSGYVNCIQRTSASARRLTLDPLLWLALQHLCLRNSHGEDFRHSVKHH